MNFTCTHPSRDGHRKGPRQGTSSPDSSRLCFYEGGMLIMLPILQHLQLPLTCKECMRCILSPRGLPEKVRGLRNLKIIWCQCWLQIHILIHDHSEKLNWELNKKIKTGSTYYKVLHCNCKCK